MLRSHAFLAIAFVALPGAALALGNGGGPTFSMYASSVEFRLDLVGHARGGGTMVVAPSLLAHALPPSARPFVAGAEHFRRAGDVTVLRRHLGDLGRLACRQEESLAAVDITLVERSERSAGASKKTAVRVRCAP